MLVDMQTTIEISEALLSRARRVMAERRMTLGELIEEGLRRVLDAEPPTFRLRDASFVGDLGFAPGFDPDDVANVVGQINQPRLRR